MKEVYAIFGGCYSDWDVEGFFLDKESAEKYCALKNKNMDYDKKYVITLSEIDADVSKVQIKWHYHVTFRIRDKQWVLLKDGCDFSRTGYVGKTKHPTFKHNHFRNGGNWFSIYFTAKDDERAEKAAYDYLAQYKALVETDGYNGAEKLMNIARP